MAGPGSKGKPILRIFSAEKTCPERPLSNLKSGRSAGLDAAPQLAAEAEGHAGSQQGQGAGDT